MYREKLPTQKELAALSDVELNQCIESAYIDWNIAIKQGNETDDHGLIFRAYDCERLNRLKRLQQWIK